MYSEFGGWPANETFSQYLARDKGDHDAAIRYLAEAIERFHVTI